MMSISRRALLIVILGLWVGSLCGCGAGAENKQAAKAGKMETTGKEEAEAEGKEAAEELQAEPVDDKYRTFYEVFVYSFYDSDGDGIGDLRGLTEKLDYINDGVSETKEDLGCNGIWLMPVMPSATYHKYDVIDYYGIDEEYGTMEDFEAFVEECGKRDIHVIMDLVINHTSSLHPWFVEASEYLEKLEAGEMPDTEECPYIEYYNFSEESKSGYEKLNDRWYYEAQFWSEMPDLNLGNPKVREEIEKIAAFWLERGIDGFRLDAAKEYYSGGTDSNIEVLTWFNQMVKDRKKDAYIVAEVWTDMSTFASYYKSGIDSVFNFTFADSSGVIAKTVKEISTAAGYGKALVTLEETLAKNNPDYIDAPFYTNHDMGRSAGYYAGENSESQTKIAGALNLMMGGCSFIYYGEELGMKGSGKDENKRAPMYWSKNAANTGMCRGPADMDEVKMKYDSLEEQSADADSIYQYYRAAIRIRNTFPEIARGKTVYLENASNDRICAVKKVQGNSEIILLMNLSDEEAVTDMTGVTLKGEEVWKQAGKEPAAVLFAERKEQEQIISVEKTRITMPPYSIGVFK